MKKEFFGFILIFFFLAETFTLEARTQSPRYKNIPDPQTQRLLVPQQETTRFNRPGDLIELVPILRDIRRMIPENFSLADHRITWSTDKMVIHKEFLDLKTRYVPKNSVIYFSYSNGLGSLANAQIEVPLFYSSYLGLTQWSRYPLGNYTVTINRDFGGSAEERVFISAQARF